MKDKTNPGDIIEDSALGRGMVVYTEVAGHPIVAFPDNPELVVCDEASLSIKGNIETL